MKVDFRPDDMDASTSTDGSGGSTSEPMAAGRHPQQDPRSPARSSDTPATVDGAADVAGGGVGASWTPAAGESSMQDPHPPASSSGHAASPSFEERRRKGQERHQYLVSQELEKEGIWDDVAE